MSLGPILVLVELHEEQALLVQLGIVWVEYRDRTSEWLRTGLPRGGTGSHALACSPDPTCAPL
jgi:hypothetical protein